LLTAELVRARPKNGELVLRPLSKKEHPRAVELATAFLGVAMASVGSTRADLDEALLAIPVAARERKLKDGLLKLVEDACEFAVESPLEPIELRSEVFLAASTYRSGLALEASFERDSVFGAVAAARGVDAGVVEQCLYADLRAEAVLTRAPALRPDALVERYEKGQVQAVLLRAVRVTADVGAVAPEAFRALFRALKFRRLLHRVERVAGGYRVEIDGPYSLFESVTKYGLELALVLPALEACGPLSLVAEVRWGKQRTPLAFRYQHDGARAGTDEAPAVRTDVATLIDAFNALGSAWKVRPCTEILELPGIGLSIPDLVFEQPKKKKKVFFEAMGFWSRDAVWKRIELVQAGLATPVLFAASSRLRVSEALLDDSQTAALYVYKGVMSPRAIERKLDSLAK
jgi:predicted nuclease of restriction endonuclease-like RecB superfamily